MATEMNKTSNIFLTGLIAVFAVFGVSFLIPQTVFAGSDNDSCSPQQDLSVESFSAADGTVTIKNSSSDCEYDVGVASYKGFTKRSNGLLKIDNQKLYDNTSKTIYSGGEVHLDIDVPSCAYQIDVFFGDVITDFSTGVRYYHENRKIDNTFAHINVDNLCDDSRDDDDKDDKDETVEPVSCTLNENNYDYFVNFEGKNNRLYGGNVNKNHQTDEVSLALPKGKYSITLQSGDAHKNRAQQVQDHEQYFVAFRNADGYFAGSGDTDDLLDGVDSATFSGEVESSLAINKDVTKIAGRHLAWFDDNVENGVNSLDALCVGLDRVGDLDNDNDDGGKDDQDDDDDDKDDDQDDDQDSGGNDSGGRSTAGGGSLGEPRDRQDNDDDDDDNGEVRGEDKANLGNALDKAAGTLADISDEIDRLEQRQQDTSYPGLPHTGNGGVAKAIQTLVYAAVLVLLYAFYSYLRRKSQVRSNV